MEKNVGKVDAGIRVIVGLVALYLAFWVSSGWISALWIVIAAIAFVTALRKNCYLYSLLGISTTGKQISKVVKKAKKKK